MMTLAVIGFVLLLALIGAPLFVIIALAAAMCFALFGDVTRFDEFQLFIVKAAGLTGKNVFLAIPFFVTAGAIMTEGGIAKRLVALARAFVGWMPGGLGAASVVACMIFGAISGSSVVTLIAVGSIMYPAMRAANYDEDFSLGLVTSAGSLGCLVPPSIAMIVYAISVSGTGAVDVGELFLAGLGPALMLSAFLIAYSMWKGLKMPRAAKFSWAEVRLRFREGVWSLALPFIILGGIYSGFFTPTEAAAVAVVYSLVVTIVIHRELQFDRLWKAIIESATLMGSLLLIIVLAFGLNDFLVEAQAGELAIQKMQEWDLSPAGFFFVVNVLLVLIGALMDSISATLIFAPLLAPAAVKMGIDPLHLGVVFVVNMEIGYLAPPVATNLFVSSALFRKPFGQVTRATMPTLGLICIGLLVVTYVPTIATGPVRLARGEPFWQPFPWEKKSVVDARNAAEALHEAAKPVSAVVAAPGNAAAPAPAAAPANRVMTLEEMMRAAQGGTADGGSAPAPAAAPVAAPQAAPALPAGNRVMTLEEMMRLAAPAPDGGAK